MHPALARNTLESDQLFMRRAIELAALARGYVTPNPMVGAVIVKDGVVVGEGWHHQYGKAHAEIEALRVAGKKAQGATIYVTLEPCCHQGKTPPCTKALVKAGIRRVVAAMTDPNPRVGGGGFEALRSAGLEVEIGLLEKESRALNQAFIKHVGTGLPLVEVKAALSLDGCLASGSGDARWISNEAARLESHDLRRKRAAVLVGVHTANLDNPTLDVRDGAPAPQPWRVVLDPHLRLQGDLSLVKKAGVDGKTIVVCRRDADAEQEKRLSSKGVKVVRLQTADYLLADVLQALGKPNFDGRAIDSVLVEGGSIVLSRFFSEGQVDCGTLYIAPIIVGDSAAPRLVNGRSCQSMADVLKLGEVETGSVGDNLRLRFVARRW